MDKLEKRILKEPEFEYIDITINETYIDDNGLERERQKKIKLPVPASDKSDINNLIPIAEKIGNEIKMLNVETEFTLQHFMCKYKVEENDKFTLCNLILDYCKNKNIIIVEKTDGEYLGLPWDVTRIKKN